MSGSGSSFSGFSLAALNIRYKSSSLISRWKFSGRRLRFRFLAGITPGAGRGSRSPNLRFTGAALCHLSYTGIKPMEPNPWINHNTDIADRAIPTVICYCKAAIAAEVDDHQNWSPVSESNRVLGFTKPAHRRQCLQGKITGACYHLHHTERIACPEPELVSGLCRHLTPSTPESNRASPSSVWMPGQSALPALHGTPSRLAHPRSQTLVRGMGLEPMSKRWQRPILAARRTQQKPWGSWCIAEHPLI